MFFSDKIQPNKCNPAAMLMNNKLYGNCTHYINSLPLPLPTECTRLMKSALFAKTNNEMGVN